MNANFKKSLYKSRKIIYTDPVNGKFNKIRLTTMLLVVISFFLLPWVTLNGRQAFLLDIYCNQFFIFNSTFWPEDFVLLAIICVMAVLFLFIATIYSGRLWCGFFCPQSIWIKMAIFISRLIEGGRNRRKKLDSMSFTFNIFFLKLLKHFFLLCLSFVTAFTFVGYFASIYFLLNKFFLLDFFYKSFFWVFFFTFLIYFNIAWFREQFCFLICPYARLQSVMFDENTLIIAYDKKRGEIRGHRKRGKNVDKLGDCVDCMRCVTCCPTGIDIRNGLQIECISCAACIDACYSVMLKMKYKPGLIGYVRENNKNIVSIRILSYIVILFILGILLSYGLITRPLVQFNVFKSQIQLYNINKNKLVENHYMLKIINKTQNKNYYTISVNDNKFNYVGVNDIILDGGEMLSIDVKLVLTDDRPCCSRFTVVVFKIMCINAGKEYSVMKKSQFVLPG